MKRESKYSLGIVGVRGYVGTELLKLIHQHPLIDISWVSSRQLKGQHLNTLIDEDIDGLIESLNPVQVAERKTDIVVLALPNGLAKPFVELIEEKHSAKIIIDLSADYRFDNDWTYSLPELDYQSLQKASQSTLVKISNPGCYASAMQLALAPIIDYLSGPAHCFGVSGYSGAGTKPGPNNDVENLKDNLIGYKLLEHLHEREVATRLNFPISFSPHVTSFFRGINMTVQVEFHSPQSADKLYQLFTDFYRQHPLVNIQHKIPVIKDVANKVNCLIGGFTVSQDGKRASIVSCLDNLLKGAASQALQNINIALDVDPMTAIHENLSKTTGENDEYSHLAER